MNRLSRISCGLARLTGKHKYVAGRFRSEVLVREPLADEDEIKNVEPRIERRKPAVEPVAKNLLLGRLAGEMLAYPEIQNKTEIEDMNVKIDSMRRCASEKRITREEFLGHLKKIGVYGAPASVFDGGAAAVLTERCRFLETLERNADVARALNEQWLGIDFATRGLPEERRREVLPELGRGDRDVRIALEEARPTDPGASDLRASYTSDVTDAWLISGDKICRAPDFKDGYIVTLAKNHSEIPSFFLVEPRAQGVNFRHPVITFKRTPGTILGRSFGERDDPEKSGKLLDLCLSHHRLGTAAISLGLAKCALREFLAAMKQKYSGGRAIGEFPLLQDAVAEAVIGVYAVESMIYYTAGLADGYESPDIAVEAMLCKAYATENVHRIILRLIGSVGAHELPPSLGECLHLARTMLVVEDTNDRLVSHAMLFGMQHAGRAMADDIKKIRNPFKFPSYVFKKMYQNRGQKEDDPECDLELRDHLHPSLQQQSHMLEYCIMRLKYATELLLSRHGAKIIEEDRNLKRLGLAVAETYASLTSLSRSSRAYCIGLHLSENELNVAQGIAYSIQKNVRRIVLEIDDDFLVSLDALRVDVGQKAFERGLAYHEHALERVFF